jgi:hypothetical protein
LVRPLLASGALQRATRAKPLPLNYAYWLICRQRALGRGAASVRKWVLAQASRERGA